MTYLVSRRDNQYDIVDDSGSFIDEWAGKKAEAFYNYSKHHCAMNGKTPYERLLEKIG